MTDNAGLVVRSARDEDAALLRQTFAESHCAGWERLPLGEAAYQQLVDLLWTARQSQYRSAFPGSREQIIEADGVAVGSCWIFETADELRVVDIAVLAGHRRRGVARAVLRQLVGKAAADNKPVRLSVWQDNAAAQALYLDLGFRRAADRERPATGYLELEWLATMYPMAMQAAADD